MTSETESKKGRGRPKIAVKPVSNGPPKREIVLDQVLDLIEIQCTAEEIAGVFRVCEDTLSNVIKEHFGMNFSELYKRCSGSGKASLRRYQFNQSKKNASMAIWLGKQWLGQKDHEKNDSDYKNDKKLDEILDHLEKEPN